MENGGSTPQTVRNGKDLSQAQNKIKTFIRGFDEQIGGGIPKGHVVLLKGKPGTLKSTIAYNLLFQNAKVGKAPGLYLTLEQSRESLLRQIVSIGIISNTPQDKAVIKNGSPIYGMNELRERFEALSEKGAWLEDFKKIVGSIRQKFPFELLAVDSLYLVEMLGKFQDIRKDLYHLIEWFRKHGITTILVSEDNSPDSPENYLCDGVIHLTLEELPNGDFQRRIQCQKMRECNHSLSLFTLLVSYGGTFQITKSVS